MLLSLSVFILWILNIGWVVSVLLYFSFPETHFFKHFLLAGVIMFIVSVAFFLCLLTIAPNTLKEIVGKDRKEEEEDLSWLNEYMAEEDATTEQYTNLVMYAPFNPTSDDDDLILTENPDAKDFIEKPTTVTSAVEFNLMAADDEALWAAAKRNVDEMMEAQLLTTDEEEAKKMKRHAYGLVSDEEVNQIIAKRQSYLSVQAINDEHRDDPNFTKEDIFRVQNQRLKPVIEALNKERREELEQNEFKQLKFQRYLAEQSFSSQRQYANETKNPYNILPLDIWYRPAPNAKNIDGTPCMCPIQNEMLMTPFAPYSENYPTVNTAFGVFSSTEEKGDTKVKTLASASQ